MKLVFVLPRFHTNFFHAAGILVARGHSVRIFCAEKAPLEDYRDVESQLLTDEDLRWSRLTALLRSLQPDLVVIRHHEGRFARLLFACRGLGIPTLGYDLRPLHRPRSHSTRLREWLRGKPVDRFTPVLGARSNRPADRRATYLPFPVSALRDPPARRWAPDGVVRILCVAKLAQPRKRHFLLLEALEGLADRRFTLTFAGGSGAASGANPDYLTRLQRYPQQGALGARVRVLADLPFAAMEALYREHDICVLASRNEPLGMAPLEAMAQGCVPVVSDDCGCADCLEPGVSGEVFPVDDVAALRARLAGLLDDPARLQRMAAAGLRRAAGELSPERFAQRFEALAGQLVAGA